ncbi:ATP-binding cassette domain-containing protein [Schinkia azotoformans]|nr:ATP-binding cassette domain-containing protein [Schinkia azotoformans]MEC1716526.1 ATP-binding cassette domain-containing protein [Schinkia azotoformans]MEC1745646.1 ATP-binding cassette domain-containing protein [Schinkia azotoformans]MEC1760630.1 ATP-binding cassette domain-containing protein [Schinkia azotoformans]MED4378255.1 ATP-binding cassette domain-containing protein [Schinkia azotoformans]
MTLINIENISKSFKGNPLFENASASFNKGKIYGIIGQNGSGKSVLFKMICGFMRPDSGEILIDSAYLEKKTGVPRNFGIIIDRPGYISGKTGFENLKRLADIQQLITNQEIKDAMKRVGLNPEAKQKVKNYSLGMKQKLALVQAFMENQEVLILDEPFNALDSSSVKIVRQLLLDFKREGKTIILTSYNHEDIDL